MTLAQCIFQVDALKHNNIPSAIKLIWLTELEQRVIIEVLATHTLSTEEDAEMDAFLPYDDDTPADTTLLIPDPYSEVYRYWLMARIDEATREMPSYSNNNSQFNYTWGRYVNWYNRTHMPYMQVSNFKHDGGNTWAAIDPLS